MQVILFEDTATARLSPITTARPACLITVAGHQLLGVVRQLGYPVALQVRPHLRGCLALQAPELTDVASALTSGKSLLMVNARLVPSLATSELLRRLVEQKQYGVVKQGESIAAALVPATTGQRLGDQPDALAETLASATDLVELRETAELLQYPHDVIAAHMRLMNESLQWRLSQGGWREVQDGVFVTEDVKIGPHTVLETDNGPILLDKGARVGAFCLLRGPVYAGPNARVIEYAMLKDGVAIGHTTKIGGEVEASIVEPYTNKQHHGFLGHSYLGSWINLGAGTCNSDLKNTYGMINMEYNGTRVATQMQFLGCVVGDYTKSAINTGIFTGKVIGVCSMLYGFVTTNVPSFVNYARLFGQIAELPPDVMIATQGRMFARRNVPQRDEDRQLIRDMYTLTRHERESALQQLSGL